MREENEEVWEEIRTELKRRGHAATKSRKQKRKTDRQRERLRGLGLGCERRKRNAYFVTFLHVSVFVSHGNRKGVRTQ